MTLPAGGEAKACRAQTEEAQAGTRSQAETGSQTGKESTGEQKLNRNEKQVEAP